MFSKVVQLEILGVNMLFNIENFIGEHFQFLCEVGAILMTFKSDPIILYVNKKHILAENFKLNNFAEH